ncbi:MAG: hypothetical protein ABIO76_09610, partial [Ginsengibacter sp.]
MWRKKILYTILIFLLSQAVIQNSFAQTRAARDKDSIANEYTENYKELLVYKMSLGGKEDGFDIVNTSRYKIRSNNKTKLSAGI